MLLGLLATLAVAGCNQQATGEDLRVDFFPPAAGSQEARAINSLYPIVFAIAIAVFLLVEGLIIFSVIRYRRRNDDLPPQIHGSNRLELLWTAIPTIIVIGLFVMTYVTLETVEARPPEASQGAPPGTAPSVVIDVTGFQWQWTVSYPDDNPGPDVSFTGAGTKGPEVVIPVNELVRFRLHSNDVIHSFYVPHFLYKKDVVAGRVNTFDVVMTQPATYTGQCAEFCGLSHAQMFFTVRGVPRSEYDQWLSAETAKAAATPPPPPPAPSGAPGGPGPAAVTISASNAAGFDQPTVDVPGGGPLTITFENKDPSAPHNVSIKQATPAGDFVGQPIAPPGKTETYQAPPLAPGQYQFYCVVHPNMVGTLNVK